MEFFFFFLDCRLEISFHNICKEFIILVFMEQDSDVGTRQSPFSFWIKGSTSGLASTAVPSRRLDVSLLFLPISEGLGFPLHDGQGPGWPMEHP